MSVIENLERMLSEGKDNALLRFGLADAYFKHNDYDKAALHLEAAIALDPDYSAAWKLLGKTHLESGHAREASRAFKQGIAVAERKGDVQAAREMTVFLKRLSRET